LLGSWSDFRRNYERPIVDGDETARDKKIKQLQENIKGHYLRRLKEEALELPPKEAIYIETHLAEEQFQIYRQIASDGKAGGKGTALAAIQKLIRISAHPLALETKFNRLVNRPEIRCPKLEETVNVLKRIKEKSEKAIIFTDFKALQRILQNKIRNEFGIWPDIINGEITKNRQQIIDIFSEKDGFNVIILGHQVAGVGLNITEANHVIHYTRPWNPAKENQATDRVHRIGQSKKVSVYYPIVRDDRFVTVEQRLDELIKSKESLARDVLRPTSELKISPEDLLDCLNVA